MGNAGTQRDNTPQILEIVCSMIVEVQNELSKGQKHGDATKVEKAGRTDVIGEKIAEELIQATVKNHEFAQDPETGLTVRIVDGKVVKVNEQLMEEVIETRKKQGKSIEFNKGPKIDKGQEH